MKDPMDGIREIENQELVKLPKDSDSRTQRSKITTSDGKYERTYCLMCGRPWGWVSTDTGVTAAPSHIAVTCDDCDQRILSMGGGDISKFPLKPVPGWLLEAFGIVPEKKLLEDGSVVE
jgi:hypothetical protein